MILAQGERNESFVSETIWVRRRFRSYEPDFPIYFSMLIMGPRALPSFLLTLSQSRNWTLPSPHQMPIGPKSRIIDDISSFHPLRSHVRYARTHFDICRREESLEIE